MLSILKIFKYKYLNWSHPRHSSYMSFILAHEVRVIVWSHNFNPNPHGANNFPIAKKITKLFFLNDF
jgi:hypothetical protein